MSGLKVIVGRSRERLIEPTPFIEGGYVDADGTHHDTLTDFVRSELGWCGCGFAEDAMQLVREVLAILDLRSREGRERPDGWKQWTRVLQVVLPDTVLGEVLLFSLDAAGWLEHGSTIRGSWLTENGELALRLLDRERGAHCTCGRNVDGSRIPREDCPELHVDRPTRGDA